ERDAAARHQHARISHPARRTSQRSDMHSRTRSRSRVQIRGNDAYLGMEGFADHPMNRVHFRIGKQSAAPTRLRSGLQGWRWRNRVLEAAALVRLARDSLQKLRQ